MVRTLTDNVSVGGKWYRRGQSEVEVGDAAGLIGDHAWQEVESGADEASAPPPVVEVQAEPEAQPAVEPAEQPVPVDVVEDESDDEGDVDDESPEPEAVTPEEPPHSGPGSSAKAWREYAAALGVEVADDAKRDDVIEALEAKKAQAS